MKKSITRRHHRKMISTLSWFFPNLCINAPYMKNHGVRCYFKCLQRLLPCQSFNSNYYMTVVIKLCLHFSQNNFDIFKYIILQSIKQVFILVQLYNSARTIWYFTRMHYTFIYCLSDFVPKYHLRTKRDCWIQKVCLFCVR